MEVLGIDVGGSGVKGAIVDTQAGVLLTERHRIDTPQPATPEAVAHTIKALVDHFQWTGLTGCGFPATVTHGFARTAANIDDSFINTNVNELFSKTTGVEIHCVNDADAAGEAEVIFGQGKGIKGTVILVTIGTGLGTAVFLDGQLVPNTEFGHMYLENGIKAEIFASDAARKRDGLRRKEWAVRFNGYLQTMENLFWPDLFILGGGASKKLPKFASLLTVKTPVVAASMLNEAGIVGAALFAQSKTQGV